MNNNMDKNLETAMLAGGCFWCTEAIFKRLKGVVSVIPGYTGGKVENPSYDEVCSGKTGHAEAIKIVFDPEKIPYEKILEVFWHTHDPTTLNQQGNDIGTEYRSTIFYQNNIQKKIAEKSKAKIENAVTEIVPLTKFYPAEEYHKNYYDLNRDAPYCNVIIDPKIHKLMEEYRSDVK